MRIQKNEVIAELIEENVKAKSQLGPLEGVLVPHNILDNIVEYMNYWS
jgi:hypothetical protein